MTKTNDVIVRGIAVIGGGPAGMMAASTAAELGADVVLFDKNKSLGRKLRITGKGRCNVTNHCTVQEFITNVLWIVFLRRIQWRCLRVRVFR